MSYARAIFRFCKAKATSSCCVDSESISRSLHVTVLQEVGAGILQNLHSQRQTITHARDTLHGADDNIAKSRRILAGMSRRIMTNKVVMFGIIGLLVAAIIIVIYFKIKS